MADRTLILFDDEVARSWEPFALTRPAGELMFGALTQRARAERLWNVPAGAHLAADHLRGFREAGAPPVRGFTDPPRSGDRLFLCSRAVPEWGSAGWPQRAGAIAVDDEIVGWYAPAGTEAPDAEWLRSPKAASHEEPVLALPGTVLRHVWQLVSELPAQIARDVTALAPPATPTLPDGVFRFGDHPVALGDGVRIEPGVVFDTTGGPIWIDRGTTVRAFTRLAGPAYIGTGCTVLGGSVEAVAVGPVCKLRGEVAESVLLGYVNKAHDGHIGHAYLGRWVNLGAETSNSDLKNNYGNVRLWTPDGETDTGTVKLGCLLGDHVKTGIGLLLNTGTVVGAGSNLYGAAMPPKYVPPFSWGTGDELAAFRLDRFLEVAERAMSRRGVALDEPHRQQLRAAWERSRGTVALPPRRSVHPEHGQAG